MKDLAIKARELLAAGWVKGHSFLVVGGRPCFCLLGAFNEAARIADLNRETGFNEYMDKIYALSHEHHNGGLACWNDAPERSHEDVLAFMEYVIREIDND